eukprot:8611069-Pyramimonas_sp.AAC.1
MDEFGRNLPEVRRVFLPEASMGKVVSYYYNVWKPKYTAAAERWYVQRAAERVRAAKEEEAKKAKLRADQAKLRAAREFRESVRTPPPITIP